MHADDYDWGSHGKRFKFNKLNQTYTVNKIKKYTSSTSKCSLFSQKENNKGQIEIQLRVNN
jgi:hypothetical protein